MMGSNGECNFPGGRRDAGTGPERGPTTIRNGCSGGPDAPKRPPSLSATWPARVLRPQLGEHFDLAHGPASLSMIVTQ
jgi:hypothetical protein